VRKIKIIGALTFFISIILIILFNHINTQNAQNSNLIKTINQQKAFTQEISKNIFYISKHKDASTKQLNDSIKYFLSNMENRDDNLQEITSHEIKQQSLKIMKLWNEFYISVQRFKDQKKITTTYSNILLEKTVVDIYNQNLKLVVEFDKLLKISKEYINSQLSTYKNIQYSLFLVLVFLLLYLFTQLKSLLEFMQKFLNTSKKIITNSSIQELKRIDIDTKTEDVSEATSNFNQLVQNINESVEFSSQYLEHSYKSLEIVENKIEDLMELIYAMEDNKQIDEELTKKEDALIQSLEELTSSAQKLKNLKTDLENLISHYKK